MRKKILGSHVKRLLSGVSTHGRRHLSEVETDLLQTELLLEEAVEKLTSSFMAIHSAVGARQETIDRLVAAGTLSGEDAAALAGMSGEIGTHVNTAITSMQFQDMTSQLIERCLTRLSGLQDLLQSVGEEHGGSADQLQARLALRSQALSDELQKSVRQNHMESGDIELF